MFNQRSITEFWNTIPIENYKKNIKLVIFVHNITYGGNYFALWKNVEEAKQQAIFMGSQENVRVGSMIVCLWSIVAVTDDDSVRIFVGWHWFSHHSKNLGPFKFIGNIGKILYIYNIYIIQGCCLAKCYRARAAASLLFILIGWFYIPSGLHV